MNRKIILILALALVFPCCQMAAQVQMVVMGGGNITILIMRINQLIVFRQPPSMLIKKVAVWLLTQALWGRL